MASGNGDPVFGLPFTGTTVPQTQTFPRTATVLDTLKLTRITITRTATDKHRVASGPNKFDTYHE